MLVLSQLSLRRGVKLVLERASVTINPGEKVGLVGRNGAGKSSLFSLLAGRLTADAGDAQVPAKWRIAEVAQDMPETDEPATDFVLSGDTLLVEAQAMLDAAEADDDGHAMGEAHQAISEAGGFDARPRAQAMLMGLGFKIHELDAPVNSFSGGWRMRLQLARALMCPADLMLLDEPTNHLDLDALVWLENWLQRYAGTLIVISHDREFLDAVTKVILHLDAAALTRYSGNYTAFEEMRAVRLMQAAANVERQRERMAHLQSFIDRFKAKATKARQAQSRVKALARMEKLSPVLTAAEFQFEFREPQSLPNPMLAFSGVDCGYMKPPLGEYTEPPPEGADPGLGRPGAGVAAMKPPHAEYTEPPPKGADPGSGRPGAGVAAARVIVSGIDRSVLAGQRIGILGANGQGKSTLVKTIAGDLQPLAGEIVAGKGLKIGYFAQQELDVLSPADGALMHMIRLARDVGPAAREQELRDFLGSFRFTGEMAAQPVGTLSGGEKARLVLAMLVWQRPNLLLLDEPTNHLDLSTREALSMALNEFEGSVMLVSHDRALLREVCDEFWLVAGGALKPFDGDLDDYQRWLLEQSKAASRPSRSERPAVAAPARASRPVPVTKAPRADRKAAAQARQQRADASRPLRQEITKLDNKLGVLFSERDALETTLSGAGLAPAELADGGKRLKAITTRIDELEARWLELSTQLDEVTESVD